MFDDPKFRYPNTDAGKDKLIADLNVKVRQIRAHAASLFSAPCPRPISIIKRVPKNIEAGAPGGYYQNGSLDGKRPGTYYINLRDTAEVPSWTLPTLTYHEGIPGHHLQGTIAQESPLPLIRKISGFTAYVEGWALYAEQLAVEIGLYDKDPWGHIGQLHDAQLRAVRLVIDTGLHAMHWSREQAIKYYADTLGDPVPRPTTEVERYCVWPGQACGYMIGKLTFLRLRDKAKAALGARFDIRKFHDAVLLSGALPLAVLEKIVDDFIARNKARALARARQCIGASGRFAHRLLDVHLDNVADRNEAAKLLSRPRRGHGGNGLASSSPSDLRRCRLRCRWPRRASYRRSPGAPAPARFLPPPRARHRAPTKCRPTRPAVSHTSGADALVRQKASGFR